MYIHTGLGSEGGEIVGRGEGTQGRQRVGVPQVFGVLNVEVDKIFVALLSRREEFLIAHRRSRREIYDTIRQPVETVAQRDTWRESLVLAKKLCLGLRLAERVVVDPIRQYLLSILFLRRRGRLVLLQSTSPSYKTNNIGERYTYVFALLMCSSNFSGKSICVEECCDSLVMDDSLKVFRSACSSSSMLRDMVVAANKACFNMSASSCFLSLLFVFHRSMFCCVAMFRCFNAEYRSALSHPLAFSMRRNCSRNTSLQTDGVNHAQGAQQRPKIAYFSAAMLNEFMSRRSSWR